VSAYDAINLSQLPMPAAVEVIDFEAILAALKADLLLRAPELTEVLNLESEPVVKLLEAFAFREMILRARINDSVRAVHLPTATGSDLDALAALFGVLRLEVTAANPLASPPTAAVLESDTSLRLRTQLSLEGFSVAGPRGAYVFHARSADGRVRDVSVDTPAPGSVRVTVLSSELPQGVPTAPVLAAVTERLNADDVRPLSDSVIVQPAAIVTYEVIATITLQDGPDPTLVLEAARAAVAAYVRQCHSLGTAVRLAGLNAAMWQPGVTQVVITEPASDIVPTLQQAPFCIATAVMAVPA
jgi:phage-related baseplate assembly protein